MSFVIRHLQATFAKSKVMGVVAESFNTCTLFPLFIRKVQPSLRLDVVHFDIRVKASDVAGAIHKLAMAGQRRVRLAPLIGLHQCREGRLLHTSLGP